MKNLIDELNTLDEIEYDVSPKFSKNVMKEIYRKKRTTNLIKVASVASVACISVLGFIFVKSLNLNKQTIADNSIFMSSGMSEEMTVEPTDTDNVVTENSVNMPLNVKTFQVDIPTTKENVEDTLSRSSELESIKDKKGVFVKTYNYENYLNEIVSVLQNYGYIITINDNTILVNSNDLDTLKSILSSYANLYYELQDDKIKIDINI